MLISLDTYRKSPVKSFRQALPTVNVQPQIFFEEECYTAEQRFDALMDKKQSHLFVKALRGDCAAQTELGVLLVVYGEDNDATLRGYKWLLGAAASGDLNALEELELTERINPWIKRRYKKEC